MSLLSEIGQGRVLEPCRILMWVTQDLEVIFLVMVISHAT